ncbi:MAG TPA: MazG family protein, partial [Anaerolineae bacterium]|nr:MazG family protein [Anaerolineae bacterium]
MGKITIIGLGCGDERYVTREAWGILQQAQSPVWLRTEAHPVVAALPCVWQSFDQVYRDSAEFETVYAHIIDTIIALGQQQDVIYCVPGDPHVGESTTFGILQQAEEADIAVHVVRGLSFYEPIVAAIGLDGMDGVQIYDAITIAQHLYAPINPDAPLILGQVYSKMLASELKLALMAVYAAEYEVQLIHGAGTGEESAEILPLYQIDRSENIGNLTTLYVPARESIGSIGQFADTVAILRSPNGCPWDREQTPQSLR